MTATKKTRMQFSSSFFDQQRAQRQTQDYLRAERCFSNTLFVVFIYLQESTMEGGVSCRWSSWFRRHLRSLLRCRRVADCPDAAMSFRQACAHADN